MALFMVCAAEHHKYLMTLILYISGYTVYLEVATANSVAMATMGSW